MQVRHTARTTPEVLLDPDSRIWSGSPAETVALIGTPAGLQPTAAIRVAWTGKSIGAVERVSVAAVHDGETLAFRLEWEDASEDAGLDDNTSFPDAAAIVLPAVPGAPIMTMGAADKPVTACYWRADEPNAARLISAVGLGTSRTFDQHLASASGHWKEGRWRVVITRPLQISVGLRVAQLAPGDETGFGVAIWEGSHAERGGIKAFSGDWLPLSLDPIAAGRNS